MALFCAAFRRDSTSLLRFPFLSKVFKCEIYLICRLKCIIIIILLLESFSGSLSDNKSSHVSRTLCSVLADLNNAVVWIVSTHPLNSKFSSRCTNPSVIVQRTQITTGVIVTFMLHSFFCFFFNPLARS